LRDILESAIQYSPELAGEEEFLSTSYQFFWAGNYNNPKIQGMNAFSITPPSYFFTHKWEPLLINAIQSIFSSPRANDALTHCLISLTFELKAWFLLIES
jgi:hypothetical protein